MGYWGCLTFLFLLQWRGSLQAVGGFTHWFMNNINYPSDDYKLIKTDGSAPIYLFSGYNLATQCAARCYAAGNCLAFNFNSQLTTCELLDGNDKVAGFTLLYEEGYVYFRRETFAINPVNLIVVHTNS